MADAGSSRATWISQRGRPQVHGLCAALVGVPAVLVTLLAACQPLPGADQFGWPDAAGDASTADSAGAAFCGDGTCNAEETAAGCPLDCGFLLAASAGPCSPQAAVAGCPEGFACVASHEPAGGTCVAEHRSWSWLGENHSPGAWQVAAESFTDLATGLTWCGKVGPAQAWNDASRWCQDLSCAGGGTWRLPTIRELTSLIDPAAPVAIGAVPDDRWLVAAGPAWSASPWIGHSQAWQLDLATGGLAMVPVESLALAACVRETSDPPQPGSGERFVIQEPADTVVDRASGLRWQRAVSGAELTWPEANAACIGNIGKLPGPGWRLPTLRELDDLIDRSRAYPALAPVFQGNPLDTLWTRSHRGDSANHWQATLEHGAWSWAPDDTKARVRCVR